MIGDKDSGLRYACNTDTGSHARLECCFVRASGQPWEVSLCARARGVTGGQRGVHSAETAKWANQRGTVTGASIASSLPSL